MFPFLMLLLLLPPSGQVSSKPGLIAGVEFHGNKQLTTEAVAEAFGLELGSASAPDSIDGALERLLAFYADQGYVMASAELKAEERGDSSKLIVTIKILQVKKVCKLGFHDTRDVKWMDVMNQIEYEMNLQGCFRGKNYLSLYAKDIYSSLYGDTKSERYGVRDRKIYDSVCVKCHKCILRIDRQKERIHNAVVKLAEKVREEHRLEQFAKDIYNENCREK